MYVAPNVRPHPPVRGTRPRLSRRQQRPARRPTLSAGPSHAPRLLPCTCYSTHHGHVSRPAASEADCRPNKLCNTHPRITHRGGALPTCLLGPDVLPTQQCRRHSAAPSFLRPVVRHRTVHRDACYPWPATSAGTACVRMQFCIHVKAVPWCRSRFCSRVVFFSAARNTDAAAPEEGVVVAPPCDQVGDEVVHGL